MEWEILAMQALTAAVSEAGGLGTIGCGTMRPDEVEKIILETKEMNLVIHLL